MDNLWCMFASCVSVSPTEYWKAVKGVVHGPAVRDKLCLGQLHSGQSYPCIGAIDAPTLSLVYSCQRERESVCVCVCVCCNSVHFWCVMSCQL